MGCTREHGDKAELGRLMCFSPCPSTFEYRRNFLLEVYSWFFSVRRRGCGNFDVTGQLWGCYSGKVGLVNPFREIIPTFLQRQLICSSFSTSCSILGGSSGVFKLPKWALKWKGLAVNFVSFFWLQTMSEKILSDLWGFLVFACINWMISGSRLGLWHPVMIRNWRKVSGGKTPLFLLHIILTECIFLI